MELKKEVLGVAMVLLQVKVAPGEASFDAQKARLQLADDDVDSHFGLRRIDPARGIYALKVSNHLAKRLARRRGVSGPFANPKIDVGSSESGLTTR